MKINAMVRRVVTRFGWSKAFTKITLHHEKLLRSDDTPVLYSGVILKVRLNSLKVFKRCIYLCIHTD